MAEREAPDTCTGKGYTPMCCDSKNEVCIFVFPCFFFVLCFRGRRMDLTVLSSRVPLSTLASLSRRLRRRTIRTRWKIYRRHRLIWSWIFSLNVNNLAGLELCDMYECGMYFWGCILAVEEERMVASFGFFFLYTRYYIDTIPVMFGSWRLRRVIV